MNTLKMIYTDQPAEDVAVSTKVVLESEGMLTLDEVLPAVEQLLRGAGFNVPIESLRVVR